MSAGPPEAPGLDELRRRLYGPDASPEDLARYRAATGERADAPERSSLPWAPPPSRRGPRPAVLVAGALVVAAALTAAVLVTGRAAPTTSASASPPVTATPESTEVPPTSLVDGLVSAPATTRADFVRALDSGRNAGLLQYFYEHPGLIPPEILTVDRADSTEYAGTGTKTIALAPSALAERGGRATVIVLLAKAGSYRWQATRVPVRQDHSGPDEVVATAVGDVEPGSPTAGTFVYDRGAPSQLSVRVAAGVRWGAVVVFTN